MGNACATADDDEVSVSSLELVNGEPLPMRTSSQKGKSGHSSTVSGNGNAQQTLEKESSGKGNMLEKESPQNETSVSHSTSAVSTHRNAGQGNRSGSQLPVDEGSATGTTTHHTDSATPDSAEHAMLGVVSAASRTHPLGDAHDSSTHPNAMNDSGNTKPQEVERAPEEDGAWGEEEALLTSQTIDALAPRSPTGNPLKVRHHGAFSAASGRGSVTSRRGSLSTNGANAPSTYVGAILPSNSSSIAEREREGATRDVEIEFEDDTSPREAVSACGFEAMLRALQPPTVCERSAIVRQWIDQVPRKSIL